MWVKPCFSMRFRSSKRRRSLSENSFLDTERKSTRENRALSAVVISCPVSMMPASTAVISFFLSFSMFMRLLPTPSHSPLRNSIFS